MKNIFSVSVVLLIMFIIGCTKDKGFENNEYGLKEAETSPIGVGFPQSANKTNVVELEPNATPRDVTTIGLVNLLSDEVAQQDLHITLVVDTSIVSNYNLDSANLNKLTVLSPSLVNTSLEVTIPKGKSFASPGITIPNPLNLDATLIYGLGLRIASVRESGVTISSNLNKILVTFIVVNPLAGNYRVSGYFFHPSVPRAINNIPKSLTTQTATRVLAPLGDLGGSNYQFSFTVDATTSGLISWNAEGATPTSPSSGFFTADNPGSFTYPALQPGAAPYVQSVYNNTYDDANGIFWMHYGYGVGSSDETGYSRNCYEKWTRQ